MLKKDEYLKTVRRPYLVLFSSLNMEGISDDENYKEVWGKPAMVKDLVSSDHWWYYAKKEMQVGGKEMLELWRKPGELDRIEKIFQEREEKIFWAAENNVNEFFEAYKKFTPTFAIFWFPEEATGQLIKEKLLKTTTEKETDELLNELNIPLRDNYYKLAEMDLVNTGDIKEHVKNFIWLNSRYGQDNPYTIEEAQEKLGKIDKTSYLKDTEENKINVKRAIARAEKLLGADKDLVHILQTLIFYRTHRTDVMNRSIYMAIPLLKKIAEEKNLSYEEILYCTRGELMEGPTPAKEIISERISDHSIGLENGKFFCFSGKESDKIRELLEGDIEEDKKVKGMIACAGKVTGVAKIVLNASDWSKVNDGDILVATMTTPNMVPIMKKAAAFVTDEGGITCHAAIISREMNKPCIIGTKNATSALEDGDVVEVDADKGIVKILEKRT